MIEFIGENCEKVFKKLDLDSLKVYKKEAVLFDQRQTLEVYSLSEDDFCKLLKISDAEWDKLAKADAWWRSAKGSVLGVPKVKFVVNGEELLAWDYVDMEELKEYYAEACEEAEEHEENIQPFEEWREENYPRVSRDLYTYMADVIGVTQPRNVAAILADLATYNHMPIHALIERYIPDAPKKGKKNHAVADSEQPEE